MKVMGVEYFRSMGDKINKRNRLIKSFPNVKLECENNMIFYQYDDGIKYEPPVTKSLIRSVM